jgi:peptide-methionine (R)-S-oxide reductase
MPYNELTDDEKYIIEDKGTESPFTGEYDDFFVPGTFICRRCNLPLFSSKAKFEAHCGWPAFDDSFPDSLTRLKDNMHGMQRIEIQCSNCGAHLGHEFKDEGLTNKNTRECVNSLSILFIPQGEALPKVLHM